MDTKQVQRTAYRLADYITRPSKERKRGLAAEEMLELQALLIEFLEQCHGGERVLAQLSDRGDAFARSIGELQQQQHITAGAASALRSRLDELDQVVRAESGKLQHVIERLAKLVQQLQPVLLQREEIAEAQSGYQSLIDRVKRLEAWPAASWQESEGKAVAELRNELGAFRQQQEAALAQMRKELDGVPFVSGKAEALQQRIAKLEHQQGIHLQRIAELERKAKA